MIQNLAFNTPVSGRSLRLTQEFNNLKNSTVMTVWFIKNSAVFQNAQAGVFAFFGFLCILIFQPSNNFKKCSY